LPRLPRNTQDKQGYKQTYYRVSLLKAKCHEYSAYDYAEANQAVNVSVFAVCYQSGAIQLFTCSCSDNGCKLIAQETNDTCCKDSPKIC